jgi:hypothetical protein
MAALALCWAVGQRTLAAQDPDREREETEDRPRRHDHGRWRIGHPERMAWKMARPDRLRWNLGAPGRIGWRMPRLEGRHRSMPSLENFHWRDPAFRGLDRWRSSEWPTRTFRGWNGLRPFRMGPLIRHRRDAGRYLTI